MPSTPCSAANRSRSTPDGVDPAATWMVAGPGEKLLIPEYGSEKDTVEVTDEALEMIAVEPVKVTYVCPPAFASVTVPPVRLKVLKLYAWLPGTDRLSVPPLT